MKKCFVVVIPIVLLIGCVGFDVKEQIVDNFYLQATDVEQQLCFAYCPDENGCYPIIPETVFAVGFNKQYFIVKQHPHTRRDGTNYFILTVNEAKERAGKDCTFTPLTLQQFEEKRKLLHIENIKFTTVYKDLE